MEGIYLVEHIADKGVYMKDSSERVEGMNLVIADSTGEAETKVYKMYEDMSDDYGEYYDVVHVRVRPTIK